MSAICICINKDRPRPPNFPEVEVSLPVNQWVEVLDWSGTTLERFSYRVTATPPTALIEWKRTGSPPVPFAEGTFRGHAEFSISPMDTTLKIELRVTDPNVQLEVNLVSRVFQGLP